MFQVMVMAVMTLLARVEKDRKKAHLCMLALFLPNPTNFMVLMGGGGVGVVLSQLSLLSSAMVGNVEM